MPGAADAGAGWPEPLSPIFLPGGVLAGYDEDLVLSAGFIALLAICHLVFSAVLRKNSVWFALHAVANGIAAVAAVTTENMIPTTSICARKRFNASGLTAVAVHS